MTVVVEINSAPMEFLSPEDNEGSAQLDAAVGHISCSPETASAREGGFVSRIGN
jgi:hypothetical protein